MPSDGLFGPMFSTAAMRDAVSDRAWLAAMLRVEAALAAAQASAGAIPQAHAAAIRDACDPAGFDIESIGRDGAESGVPVVALAAALKAKLPEEIRGSAHRGATSQDIVDTAMMLVVRDALDVLFRDVERAARAAAALTDGNRGTIMAGRTLMQQAVPIAFGLKAAGWLSGLLDARKSLARWRGERMALQLGGAAGTLASLGADGAAVEIAMARELGLAVAPMPWHTSRGRVAELCSLLGIAAGAIGKPALDIALLSQSEIGEVREGSPAGRGRSSAMPHKRNPVAAVTINACVRKAHALVPVALGAMLQENERGAGAWQAEWTTVSDIFELTGAAAANLAELLETLEVDAAVMARNVEAARGLPMAEAAAVAIGERLGGARARRAVDAAAGRAVERGTALADELLADTDVAGAFPADELTRALDPAVYLGSTERFIDRVLAEFREALAPAGEEEAG